jgi:hypothetical protein
MRVLTNRVSELTHVVSTQSEMLNVLYTHITFLSKQLNTLHPAMREKLEEEGQTMPKVIHFQQRLPSHHHYNRGSTTSSPVNNKSSMFISDLFGGSHHKRGSGQGSGGEGGGEASGKAGSKMAGLLGKVRANRTNSEKSKDRESKTEREKEKEKEKEKDRGRERDSTEGVLATTSATTGTTGEMSDLPSVSSPVSSEKMKHTKAGAVGETTMGMATIAPPGAIPAVSSPHSSAFASSVLLAGNKKSQSSPTSVYPNAAATLSIDPAASSVPAFQMFASSSATSVSGILPHVSTPSMNTHAESKKATGEGEPLSSSSTAGMLKAIHSVANVQDFRASSFGHSPVTLPSIVTGGGSSTAADNRSSSTSNRGQSTSIITDGQDLKVQDVNSCENSVV